MYVVWVVSRGFVHVSITTHVYRVIPTFNGAYSSTSYCDCFMHYVPSMERPSTCLDPWGRRRRFGGCSVSEAVQIWHTHCAQLYVLRTLAPTLTDRGLVSHSFLLPSEWWRRAPTKDGMGLTAILTPLPDAVIVCGGHCLLSVSARA